ncbi:hypothetical protein CTEN210_16730 [Chaetoceros tenuissimus]|uniref:Metalloendopeptidase n=1 Tax=Chaetoceros tenuissimus TaxID=426638 RepID=A0AAD3DCR1_9STRA|nr:hypothetical protein CTEN210_16730 [Chaetoceros tenuissimus]
MKFITQLLSLVVALSPFVSATSEYGRFLEGDIYIHDSNENFYLNPSTGLPLESSFWKDDLTAKGSFRIQVYIPIFDYTPAEYKIIQKSLRDLARRAKVVKFKFLFEKPIAGTPFLHVKKGNHCGSYVGQTQSAFSSTGQLLTLGPQCLTEGTVMHEFIHALGFQHENSRKDRDLFLTINEENIESGMEENFKPRSIEHKIYGTKYNLESVMHFSPEAFSSSGEPTFNIRGNDKKSEDYNIGQRDSASKGDIVKIRLAYQCTSTSNDDALRTKKSYRRARCTSVCTCGLYMNGCKNRNNYCSTGLICEENTCKPMGPNYKAIKMNGGKRPFHAGNGKPDHAGEKGKPDHAGKNGEKSGKEDKSKKDKSDKEDKSKKDKSDKEDKSKNGKGNGLKLGHDKEKSDSGKHLGQEEK